VVEKPDALKCLPPRRAPYIRASKWLLLRSLVSTSRPSKSGGERCSCCDNRLLGDRGSFGADAHRNPSSYAWLNDSPTTITMTGYMGTPLMSGHSTSDLLNFTGLLGDHENLMLSRYASAVVAPYKEEDTQHLKEMAQHCGSQNSAYIYRPSLIRPTCVSIYPTPSSPSWEWHPQL
jgi:hypothetical protein